MSPEFIAILSIGATLVGTQLAAVLWLASYVRGEIGNFCGETTDLREPWQGSKACSKGLRDAISGRRDTA